MKTLVGRALVLGVNATVLFLAVSLFLAYVSSCLGLPSFFNIQILAFLAGGAPVAWLAEKVSWLDLTWLPNPGDGPVGSAIAKLFYGACVSWPVLLGGVRYALLRHRPPSSNSIKSTSLRGAV